MLKRITTSWQTSFGMEPQPSPANPALSGILDAEPPASVAAAATDGANGAKPNGAAFEEEQMARLQAEAAAQDAAQRLHVAQQQMAEYANSKAADANSLIQQGQQLGELLKQLAAFTATDSNMIDSGDTMSSALAAVTALQERLGESAAEASAFAQIQHGASADSHKRSPEQAMLDSDSQNDDVKRQRSEDTSMASEDEAEGPNDAGAEAPLHAVSGVGSLAERAKYIPLRLDADERRLLRLLEAALSVSEYTDKVDILSWKQKNSRVHQQIKDICAILCGLVIAQDFRKGQKMVTNRNFRDMSEFFQDVFEVGRRYKIMNPDRMRSTYGLLMYMLMDSAESSIQELLEFKCVRPLRTVYLRLEEVGALRLLDDPLATKATAEIVAGDRSRYEVQRDIKVKEKARDVLAKKYKNQRIDEEELLQCLYSISDNNSYLLFNRDPIERMLQLLEEFFDPNECSDAESSLAISMGRAGARLSHSHAKQYVYVSQSLTLWSQIHADIFKNWYLADADLLAENNPYRLSNTGQGLNRVQAAPRVSKAMHNTLARCQRRLGGWVGSAVVHLGDHNVPNALMFIDKYTAVPRILNPVVLVVDSLPKLCKDPKLEAYVNSIWGGVKQCRKAILADFFRHAFDGSGADNFYDAGSCIDGRLTSAWNWCSKLEKKSYYHIFKVAGFHSFDGFQA